jgi:membrane-associated phospholipid phosphatase
MQTHEDTIVADGGSFCGWPGGRNLAYAYFGLGLPVFLLFAAVYAGADYLAGLHDYRVPIYFTFELAIPFVPAMVLFYNSLHIAYSITPFVLRTRAEMHAMALVWVLITLGAGIAFLLIPFEAAYPAPAEAALGPWRALYQFADDANLRFNSCPSLHVAWGIVCIAIFAEKARPFGKLVLWLWGGGMALSTLLLQFHHLADVAGGLALAMIGARVVYPRLRERYQRRASSGSASSDEERDHNPH